MKKKILLAAAIGYGIAVAVNYNNWERGMVNGGVGSEITAFSATKGLNRLLFVARRTFPVSLLPR